MSTYKYTKAHPLLFDNESVSKIYRLDYSELILTDRRIIFTVVDESANENSKIISIGYSRIIAVELAVSDNQIYGSEVTIISEGKEWKLRALNSEDGSLIFEKLSEKIFL